MKKYKERLLRTLARDLDQVARVEIKNVPHNVDLALLTVLAQSLALLLQVMHDILNVEINSSLNNLVASSQAARRRGTISLQLKMHIF